MAAKESILLTGATGNLGAVILDQILNSTPHEVNLVLRNAEKQIPLFRSKFPSETSSGRITFTPMPDMTVPGAFDTPAALATATIHCATPIGDEKDLLNTIINPTWHIDRNILEAAKKSITVKRVVICGTLWQAIPNLAALYDPSITITEESYNLTTLEEAKTNWLHAYCYAKTSAERKTWAWHKENGGKEGVGFDVVMILPPVITGRSPQLGYKPPGDSPNGIGVIYRALLRDRTAEAVDATWQIFLDNDDVARVHLECLNTEKVPGNQRYMVASPELLDLRAIVVGLKKEYPELAGRLPDVEMDEEGFKQRTGQLCKLDLSKTDAVFGTEWKKAYDSIKDIVWDVVRWEKEQGSK